MGLSNKRLMKLASILIIIFIVIIIVVFSIIHKPNEKTITNILLNNGIKINGSDSNDVSIVTDQKYDHISIHLEKKDIKDIKILESGYDFIQMKYFCIVDIATYSEKASLGAKLMIFLNYDKGWQLVDKIGVLEANFLVEE